MIKKFFLSTLFFASVFLFACGQDHEKNKSFLNKIEEIKATVSVLNNQDSIIPLRKLDELKIASLNLGFSHAVVFDSLLHKYHRISSFAGVKSQLSDLYNDLKFYNL